MNRSPVRVSSTQLGRHLQCPRAYWYYRRLEDGGNDVFRKNEKVAWGSIFHAIAEFYGLRGRLPALSEFDEMEGTYDNPGEVRARHPHLYKPAMDTFLWMLEHRDDLFDLPEGARFELPIAEWGLTCGGVPAEGVIDVYIPSNSGHTVTIRDYKTRGSFNFMPKTAADFRADVQQCYYAAAVAKANPDVLQVVVQHVNVLRPDSGGPDVVVTQARLPRWYLMGVWEFLDSTVVPDMERYDKIDDEMEIPRDKTACFRYGQCRFFKTCLAHKDEATDFHKLIGLKAADESFSFKKLLGE